MVELLYRFYSLIWLLEKTLTDVCHHSLVISDLRRDAYQSAELWRKVDVLSLLFYFKEGLLAI